MDADSLAKLAFIDSSPLVSAELLFEMASGYAVAGHFDLALMFLRRCMNVQLTTLGAGDPRDGAAWHGTFLRISLLSKTGGREHHSRDATKAFMVAKEVQRVPGPSAVPPAHTNRLAIWHTPRHIGTLQGYVAPPEAATPDTTVRCGQRLYSKT